MQLNDFSEWIRHNITVIIIVLATSVVLSVVVGSLIGSAAKKRMQPARSSVDIDRAEALSTEFTPPEPSLLLPKPIVPSFIQSSPYSFYYDGNYYDINEEELLPVTVSELLAGSEAQEDLEIEAFSIWGKEHTVLTLRDELSEP
jgi:hypothetical protein